MLNIPEQRTFKDIILNSFKGTEKQITDQYGPHLISVLHMEERHFTSTLEYINKSSTEQFHFPILKISSEMKVYANME